MPIHIPGVRDRHGRTRKGGKRSVVAVLSLTAMVDLFTVLVVFLLQNYNTTGEVLDIHDAVHLPSAGQVKDLRPSNVVVVSNDGIFLNDKKVANFLQIKEQSGWMVEALKTNIEQLISEGELKKGSISNRIKDAVSEAKGVVKAKKMDRFRRMSIQADKEIDFLTIKKILFTVTEAGIYEINFAVLKVVDQEES